MKQRYFRVVKAKTVTVDYSAGIGAGLRKKLRKLPRAVQNAVGVSMAFAWFPLFIICTSLSDQGIGHFLLTVALFPVLIAISVSLFVLYARDSILMAEKGLCFPLGFVGSLGMRTTRLWSDISKVDVLIEGADEDARIHHGGTSVKLSFFSGGHAVLKLSEFEQEGLNSFISALEEWATRCPENKRLGQLPRLYELESASDRPDLSYTKFWEEQLKDSYTFTAFVPLATGEKLHSGKLTVLSQIGSGGFSAVYLVEDDEGSRYVAKESVVPDHLDQEYKEKVREHFKREASILLKLSHERIANVYDHFVENERDYLLLEYIEGQDARDVLSREPQQSLERVIGWAMDIAEVLDYLHRQDPPVLHRDVTPDNMLIDNHGRMMLIDFGAANEYIGQATGTLVGKQSYMPPEQVRGKCTTASDLYGFGASIHFLLTGKDPEPLSCSSPARTRDDVPESLNELVESLTRLDEDDRLAGASRAREVLEKILEETREYATQASG